MNKYFEAVSLFRRNNYENCLEICNELLPNPTLHRINKKPNSDINQEWLTEGIWQLKMRAQTQRVFVDDLETNDDGLGSYEFAWCNLVSRIINR